MNTTIRTRNCIVSWWLACFVSFTISTAETNGQTVTSSVVGWSTDKYWPGTIPKGAIIPQNLTNAVAIAAEADNSVALKADGTVTNWGGVKKNVVTPAITNAVAISEGGDFSLALLNNGTVVVWGYSSSAGSTGTNILNVPPGVSNVVAIAAGNSHCLALLGNGSITAWGDNGSGQCNIPSGLTNVVTIAAGGDLSLAVLSNGTVVAWGANSASVPSNLTKVVAITSGMALLGNGTIDSWSNGGNPSVPSSLTNVLAIAFGGELLALKADGTIIAWLNDGIVGETNFSNGPTNVAAIASGDENDGFGVALLWDSPPMVLGPMNVSAYSGAQVVMEAYTVGALPSSYQWQFDGTNIVGATMPWLILSNPQSASAGNYSIVVTNAIGMVTNTVVSLSVNNSQPIITSQPQSLAVPLGDNLTFSVNVIGSGPLSYQWQLNGTNIVGATNAVLALADVQSSEAGNYSVEVSNGFGSMVSSNATLSFVRTSVVAWGDNSSGQCNVPPGLTNVVGIAAGLAHSLALNANGTIVAWGNNNSGECNVPTNLTNAVAISAGDWFTMALKNDGTVVAWGDNTYGQTNIPSGLNNVVAIAAGYDFCLALNSNGTVVAWGDNDYGQCNVPARLTNVVAIAAGWVTSFALKSDQTVLAWGDNFYGETNVPPGLTNAVALGVSWFALGGLAVKADGSLAWWGSGTNPLPAGLTNIVAGSMTCQFGLLEEANHTVVGWGDNSGNELDIPLGLTNVIAINAGAAFGLALDPAGGAITLSVGFGGTGRIAYLTANIGPPAALAAGGAWQATGLSAWSSASSYVATFSQGQSATILFKSIPGWNSPPSQIVSLTPGSNTVVAATYTPIPPIMVANAANGIGITGTTGTTYQLQYRTNLAVGSWIPLQTNTIGSGSNRLLPWPPTNGPAAYYRAVWLGQ